MGEFNCKVKLYEKSKILKERNLIVEDIENYLASLSSVTIESAQYFKNELTTTIKLDFSQVTGLTSQNHARFNYNYLSVTTYQLAAHAPRTENKVMYYFINNYKWISQNCVEFSVELDVLNSYKFNTDYSVSARTRVIREHKDRLIKNNNLLYRVIDRVSENIQLPMYKEKDSVIELDYNNYYIVYRNKEEPSTTSLDNPVEVLLYCDSQVNVGITPYAFYGVDDSILYFNKNLSLNIKSVWLDNTDNLIKGVFEYNGEEEKYLELRVGDILPFTPILSPYEDYTITAIGLLKERNNEINLKLEREGDIYYVSVRSSNFIIDNVETALVNNTDYLYGGTRYNFDIGEDSYVEDINVVNRTNSKLLKIIKIPYRPFEENSISYNWSFRWKDNTFILNNDDRYIEAAFSVTEEDAKVLNNLVLEDISNKDILRDDKYESKLFNSDYFYVKYGYDSFSYIFKLEDYKINRLYIDNLFFVTQVVTKNISSKFSFFFEAWNEDRGGTNDYINLSIERNNEVMLFNSSYINYVLNGYNYDLKSKALQNKNNAIGLVTNSVGLAASVASGNAATASLQAVNLGASIFKAINANEQAQLNIDRKLKESMSQAVSVCGSEDLDLMEYTTKNRLHAFTYSVSETNRNLLADLFFYTGYSCNEMKKPNISTRKYFNYIQCDLQVDSRRAFNDNIWYMIHDRFLEGVTILHNNNNEWDFEQINENWENNIY